jgi:hypothetical protein
MTPLKPKIKSRIPKLFFLKNRYFMGIFTYEIVLQDIHFKKKCCGPKTKILNFSGVNDPAEIVLAGSMTQLKSIKN